jgi:hypothetical protein
VKAEESQNTDIIVHERTRKKDELTKAHTHTHPKRRGEERRKGKIKEGERRKPCCVPVGTATSIVGLSQVLTCSQAKPLVPRATL